MSGSDRRSYDTSASGQAQSNLASVIGQLEALLSQRDAQVKQAMSNFQADGVSDAYHAKEQQWQRAAAETRQIITLVRSTLEKNDGTASTTLSQAKNAVDSIV